MPIRPAPCGRWPDIREDASPMPIAMASRDHSSACSQDLGLSGAGNTTDEDLMQAIHRGDVEALGTLYDRHRRAALSVALRILEDPCAAGDAVHDAFLAAWRRSETFDHARGSVRGWLLAIVRNAAIDRRRGRFVHTELDASLVRGDVQPGASTDETFASVTARMEAERVHEALHSLPAEQREAIELAYFGGLTHQEIAQRTGAALGTVKGRLRLGLHKLRASLADLLPQDHAPHAMPRDQERHDIPRQEIALRSLKPVAAKGVALLGPVAPVLTWLTG